MRRASSGVTILPGRNPDVGFLHCGGPSLTVNISTHTGFGEGVETDALRLAVDELARRAPLLVSRLSPRRHLLPRAHHVWIPPARAEPIPLNIVDLPSGAGPEATADHCARGANLAIDPIGEPPFRVDLLRRADGSSDLGITLHHALLDGASCGFVFYAVKALYAAAVSGRPVGQASLPRVTAPGEWAFALRRTGAAERLGAWLRTARALASGSRLLLREARFRDVPVPGRESSDGARSLHRTLALDLDEGGLQGLGDLLARVDGTLNELLQAAVARAFFSWGREVGLLANTLPLATTFDLRRPDMDEYPLGNFETATCVELRSEDVRDPTACLEMLVRRSRAQKESILPLGHYLALALLARAPTPLTPRIVDKVANRAILLFSYLGSDFSHRYLGHFTADDARGLLHRLVCHHPGSGAGYVTSAPPMGLVLTVKRLGRRLALNFSIHDRIASDAALGRLVEEVRDQVEGYAAAGRRSVALEQDRRVESAEGRGH